jgi:hypothetical protein
MPGFISKAWAKRSNRPNKLHTVSRWKPLGFRRGEPGPDQFDQQIDGEAVGQ